MSDEDLRRVTVARCAEPLCEMERSLRALQLPARDPATVLWRQWARRRLPKAARPLLTLVPAAGPSPDFLTPLTTSPDLGGALESVLRTPPSRLAADLDPLVRRPGSPRWLDDLRRGGGAALHRLEVAVRSYHGALLQPVRQHVTTEFDVASGDLTDTLAHHGLDALLENLHPSIRWEPPVLHVTHERLDEDVSPRGRGLHLIPSFFACGNAVMEDAFSPCVVVFPMARRTPWSTDASRPERALAALLGDTRAALLYAIAQGHAASTASLARQTGIADSTASHHVKALRNAQLVTTRRAGTGVLHTLTPLGARMVRSSPHGPDGHAPTSNGWREAPPEAVLPDAR